MRGGAWGRVKRSEMEYWYRWTWAFVVICRYFTRPQTIKSQNALELRKHMGEKLDAELDLGEIWFPDILVSRENLALDGMGLLSAWTVL